MFLRLFSLLLTLLFVVSIVRGDEICDRCVQMVRTLRNVDRNQFTQSAVQQICFESYIRCSHGNKFCSLNFLTSENVNHIQQEIESGARDAQVCDRVLSICRIE